MYGIGGGALATRREVGADIFVRPGRRREHLFRKQTIRQGVTHILHFRSCAASDRTASRIPPCCSCLSPRARESTRSRPSWGPAEAAAERNSAATTKQTRSDSETERVMLNENKRRERNYAAQSGRCTIYNNELRIADGKLECQGDHVDLLRYQFEASGSN